MIEIDGNYLEGGGQIVRTALALSMLTQKPFHVVNIRKRRKDPGLKNQHLTGITTLINLSGSRCEGVQLGSQEITFYPKPFKPQKSVIDIGTAGSITLLLQTILLPALLAKKGSSFEITGGTDVSFSPSIDYFIHVLVPHLKKYAKIDVHVLKRGYYPRGGGKMIITIRPSLDFDNRHLGPPVHLIKRGKLVLIKGVSHCSQDLEPQRVAQRQAKAAEFVLHKFQVPTDIIIETSQAYSAGSGITLWAQFIEQGEIDTVNPEILGADHLGERGVAAEEVASTCATSLSSQIDSLCPVDLHLADQLIPLLGLFGGRIKASEITNHTRTNVYITNLFLDTNIVIDEKEKIIATIQGSQA